MNCSDSINAGSSSSFVLNPCEPETESVEAPMGSESDDGVEDWGDPMLDLLGDEHEC